MLKEYIVIIFCLIVGLFNCQGSVVAKNPQRLRPPDAVKCSRNELTAFTGVITKYCRTTEHLILKMKTDEQTRESFMIKLDRTKDIKEILLLNGEPFKEEDWATVESRQGILIKGMRATVWVCQDGSKVIDWQPPAK